MKLIIQGGMQKMSASVKTSDQNGLKWWGEQWAERILHSELGRRALDYGIATDNDLEEISRGWLEWVDKRGAFFTFIHVEIIGVRD